MAKIILNEGDVFSFPINNLGYGFGLIVRVGVNNMPLGFFFNDLFEMMPKSIPEILIDRNKVILIKKFGLQGFKDGSWKIIGKINDFKREEWPMPVFYHHTLPSDPELVYYDDDLNEIDRKKIINDIEKYKDYPKTGLGGSEYIEKIIYKKITSAN